VACFAVEEATDRHQGAIAGEALDACGEEAVVEHGVGVHAHYDVVVSESVEQPAERLVECPRFLLGVAHGDEYLRAVGTRDVFGRIRAIVGDDDDAVRRTILGPERVERRSDGGCLVVGRDENGDRDRSAEHATGLGHHELGSEQLHRGIGRASRPVHDDPFDEGHAGGEDQTETNRTDHDGDGRRLGVVEDVPCAEHRGRLRGLIDRRGACRRHEPQHERAADGDRCDEQSDVAAEPATGVSAPRGPDIVMARAGGRPAVRPGGGTTSGVTRRGRVGVVESGRVALRRAKPPGASAHDVDIGRPDRRPDQLLREVFRSRRVAGPGTVRAAGARRARARRIRRKPKLDRPEPRSRWRWRLPARPSVWVADSGRLISSRPRGASRRARP